MNRTAQIKALDNSVGWQIVFEKSLPDNLYFASHDEVVSFLRSERDYWKNREKGDAFPATPYSEIIAAYIDVIEAVLKDVSSENIVFHTVMSSFNTHAAGSSVLISAQGQHRDFGGKNKTCLHLTIPCHKSTGHGADAVSFAYETLYLKGFVVRFDTFVKIVTQQNESVSKYLGNFSGEQQQGAIDYLAYMIKNSALPNKDLFAQDVIADYDSKIKLIGKSLLEKRKEIESFSEESAQSFNAQFAEQQEKLNAQADDIDAWYQNAKAEFKKTETLYSESLKFKEPAKHWEDEASKQRIRYNKSLWLTVALSIGLIAVVAAILLHFMFGNVDYSEISKYVPQSFFLIGLIAFLFYIIRTFIKITLSAKQLETIYNEKCAFTYFYLALLQDDTIKIEPNERILVFNTLFSTSETGLVKSSDSKGDVEATILALLGRNQ